MALGASLQAASATAKAMGLFKNSNSRMLNHIDRAATVAQVAGAGAVLLGDRFPAIQKSLERNGVNAGGISAAVHKMMKPTTQEESNPPDSSKR